MGIAGIVTAVATTVGTAYVIRAWRMRQMNPVHISEPQKILDFFLVYVEIFPAHNSTSIRRISTDAEGIAIAEGTDVGNKDFRYISGQAHHKSVPLQFDLLPDVLSKEPVGFFLSIKPRSSQSFVAIRLYKSHSFFTLPISKKAIIIRQVQ